MTPVSRLICTVQVEGAVHAVPLVLGRNLFFGTHFGTWYLLFWRASGVMDSVLGLL